MEYYGECNHAQADVYGMHTVVSSFLLSPFVVKESCITLYKVTFINCPLIRRDVILYAGLHTFYYSVSEVLFNIEVYVIGPR